ncbi:MAG: transketolase [Acidobacteria bacterium]|nr:transketolase [Acidobacteriota bacterium]MCB9397874.1 transketolase [Acidobacteriota bacterium]
MNAAVQAQRARQLVLAMIYHAGSGHPGGSLSAIECLLHLYLERLQPGDRFVLSKGHAAPALYAVLALTGHIPFAELATFRKLGSRLQGHPSVADLPQVEASTGSLGQGFSAAIGMALGNRYQGRNNRFYTLLGDGECQEGEVWEGAMFAAHYRLNHLTAIIDYNKLQSDDRNANILGLEPLRAKWTAFGWHVTEIDGHDWQAWPKAFEDRQPNQPHLIIAHTLKGKGVSYMEDKPPWHGSVKLNPDELCNALRECGCHSESVEEWLALDIFERLAAVWEVTA